jgi:hypothetical protein
VSRWRTSSRPRKTIRPEIGETSAMSSVTVSIIASMSPASDAVR